MIKIFFFKINNVFKKVIVKGHADKSVKFNKNLICAAITGIMSGILNAINQIEKNNCNFIIKNGLIIINIVKNNYQLQLIFKILFFQLQIIYLQYNYCIILKEIKL